MPEARIKISGGRLIDPDNQIDDLLDLVVEQEVDGIYLLRQGGPDNLAIEVDRTAEEAIHLDRVEVAGMRP